MNQYWNPDDPSRDPSDPVPDSQLRRKGFSLSPPFAQIVQGHSVRFWLNVSQEAFPEVAVGDGVEIACRTDEIRVEIPFALMEIHPTQPSVLRAVWNVKGERETPATAVSARVGPIVAETPVEVLASEKDKYSWVHDLCFGSKRYVVRTGSRKQIELLMPLRSGAMAEIPVVVSCDHRAFQIQGEPVLRAVPELGILRCRLRVTAKVSEARGTMTAKAEGSECSAAIVSTEPSGFAPEIKIRDKDFGNQRSFWRGTVLEIGARHPSLKRYLGPPDKFPGQEERHFRLLLAEIVAEAVCAKIISKTSEENPQEFQDADWEDYYVGYTKLLTEFLPIAHKTQLPVV